MLTAKTVTHTYPTIGTSASTTLLAANQARIGFIIQNYGSNPLWINLGAAAVVGQCILIIPNGSFSLDKSLTYQGAVNGLSQTGGNVVLVTDMLED